jgi:hypothetical protein
VIAFDEAWRPVVTYQTVETQRPTRWITSWRADPEDGAANPVDVVVADEREANLALDRVASGVGSTPWTDLSLAAPGTRCSLGLRVASASTELDLCPLGPLSNPVGPNGSVSAYAATATTPPPAGDPGPATKDLVVVATVFSPSGPDGPRSVTAPDLAPGIWVWRAEPGEAWAAPPPPAS